MLSEKLFEEILVKPAGGCDQLHILSGYASPAMANRHLARLPNLSIELLVGMVQVDGMGRGGHNGFVKIQQSNPRFKCSYLITPPAAHIKSYIWLNKGTPKIAFTGSGNYSQNAFLGITRESFAEDDPIACEGLYQNVLKDSLSCLSPQIETKINFYEEIYKRQVEIKAFEAQHADETVADILAEDCKVLSLLSTRFPYNTHEKSGLNWGQRAGRDPDQAYIPVPSHIGQSDFFPDKATHFTVITDDGQSFDCVIAQDGNKAIETPKNNSILGKYFRKRLGLPNGAYVSRAALETYGRTDVRICKLDHETYFLDFSI